MLGEELFEEPIKRPLSGSFTSNVWIITWSIKNSVSLEGEQLNRPLSGSFTTSVWIITWSIKNSVSLEGEQVTLCKERKFTKSFRKMLALPIMPKLVHQVLKIQFLFDEEQ